MKRFGLRVYGKPSYNIQEETGLTTCTVHGVCTIFGKNYHVKGGGSAMCNFAAGDTFDEKEGKKRARRRAMVNLYSNAEGKITSKFAGVMADFGNICSVIENKKSFQMTIDK